MADRVLAGTLLAEQIDAELNMVRNGVLRYRRAVADATRRGKGANLKPAERLLAHWFKSMVLGVRKLLRDYKAGRCDAMNRNIWGPILLSLGDPERVAVIAMHEMVSRCMSQPAGVKVVEMAYAIGRAIVGEIHLDLLKKDHRADLRALEKHVRNFTPEKINWCARRILADFEGSRKSRAMVGAQLLWLLIGVANVNSYDDDEKFELAFLHRHRRGTYARVSLSPMAFKVIDDGHTIREMMRPRYEAMIVEPFPWTKEVDGGYTRIRTPFISKPTGTQKLALVDADLSRIHHCLNAVNSTPWRINQPVLDIVRRLYAEGGNIAGIPRADDIPLPKKPRDIGTNADAKLAWKKEAYLTYKANRNLRADRETFLRKLDQAERFADRKAIWFPHQLDFRGRTYAIPMPLNHQSEDVSRGLLEFSEDRPLDRQALRWLAIHTANCYGADHCSYDDRIAWVKSHTHEIGQVVRDPLGPSSSEFWLSADKPVQFLAACLALGDAGNTCRLPVQLDGSCNGLQHYAALGRDEAGAAAVNLTPGDAPADVYAQVAAKVQEIATADAAAGKKQAKWIINLIDRSLVKQPTMTQVYGVTMVGARKQLFGRLKEAGLEEERLYQASQYLTGVVLRAVANICTSAGEIMQWMWDCARIISNKPIRQPVSWTTPLGLPVVQPYRKYRRMDIRTILQDIRLIVEDERVQVWPRRQVNGFPPNWIHSIDATHMLMTAEQCHAEGIRFAAVHDSYWSHAADIDQMNIILRDQFIALHELPLLESLRESFVTRWPTERFPDLPEKGNLDLSLIRESPYIFN